MPEHSATATLAPASFRLAQRIESSFRTHSKLWLCSLLVAGFFVRLWHASGTFLNSDEAQHFAIANQPSLWQTYTANLRVIAHPPLLVLLLHGWRHLGTSELMLRLPSILAGTAFCWLTFKWMSLLLDETAAWIAFIFVLFLPSSIQLSTEIRQYPLLLVFSVASAYFLERALAQRSAALMCWSSLCLWLAIFSHFSAFLFAAVLGAYAVWRLLKDRVPLRVFAVWEFGQVIALGLAYFFYVTQFAALQQSYGGSHAARGQIFNSYLAKSYFTLGSVNPFAFVLSRTGSFFQFTFTQLVIGDMALLAFIAGIVIFLVRPSVARINSRQLALLLTLPFIVTIAAALLHAYPYGGVRQDAFLLPFAIAGISVAVAWLAHARITPAIAGAALIAGLCQLLPAKQLLPDPPGANRLANMTTAISFIRQQIPSSEPLIVDPQTSALLDYYLCGQHPGMKNYSRPDFISYECEGRTVIVAKHEYMFTPQQFPPRWQDLIREYNLPSGSKICIVQMGWATHLAAALGSHMSLAPHYFGSEIQVFELTVGESLPDPSLLPPS